MSEKRILGNLFVRVLEAKDLKYKGGSGTRNSYAELRLGDSGRQICKTDVVWKSLHPIWKAAFNFEIEEERKEESLYLDLIVWDKNVAIKDTFLGYISIIINTKKSNSRTLDKWFSLKKKEKITGEIHLQLRFVTFADMEIMRITEGKMDDPFLDSTHIEVDDTLFRLIKATGEDSVLSTANELIMNRGRDMVENGVNKVAQTTLHAAKASKDQVKSLSKKAQQSMKDKAIMKHMEKSQNIVLKDHNEVIKRGYLYTQRKLLNSTTIFWQKKYYILVGKPDYQLRVFNSINSSSVSKIISFSDVFEVQRVNKIDVPNSNKGSVTPLAKVGLSPPLSCLFAFIFRLPHPLDEKDFIEQKILFAALTSVDKEDWLSKCTLLLDNLPDDDNNNNINNNNNKNDRSNEEIKNLKKKFRMSKQVYNLDDFDDGEDEFSLAQKQPNFNPAGDDISDQTLQYNNNDGKKIKINLNNNNNNNNNKTNKNNNNNNTNNNNNSNDSSDEEDGEEIVNQHIESRRKYTVNLHELIRQKSIERITTWMSPRRSSPRPDSIRVLSEDRHNRNYI